MAKALAPGTVSHTTSRTSSLVLTGRLVLLVLAAAATVFGFALSRGRDVSASVSGERYVCPMHPEVVSSAPSECPICRMALEQVSTSRRGTTESQLSASMPAAGDDPSSAPEHAEFSVEQSATLKNYKMVGAAQRRIFAQEVRAPAWSESGGLVTAVLYNDELIGLSPEECGSFFRASAPSVGIAVRLTAKAPAPWDGSTSRVEFRVDSTARTAEQPRPAPELEAGEVGWVTLGAKPRELLVVPANAVLYSSHGPHVLVVSPDGQVSGRRPSAGLPDGRAFSKRRVEVGKTFRGATVVLSGLRAEEPIAVSNTFFLDAERRLQSDGTGEAMP